MKKRKSDFMFLLVSHPFTMDFLEKQHLEARILQGVVFIFNMLQKAHLIYVLHRW